MTRGGETGAASRSVGGTFLLANTGAGSVGRTGAGATASGLGGEVDADVCAGAVAAATARAGSGAGVSCTGAISNAGGGVSCTGTGSNAGGGISCTGAGSNAGGGRGANTGTGVSSAREGTCVGASVGSCSCMGVCSTVCFPLGVPKVELAVVVGVVLRVRLGGGNRNFDRTGGVVSAARSPLEAGPRSLLEGGVGNGRRRGVIIAVVVVGEELVTAL